MLKRILMPAMIGAAVALTGTAFADSMKNAKSDVYKESQPRANASVKDKAVNPDAKLNKKLYKNAQPADAGKAVMDKEISPNADINKKLYKESQESALPGGMKKTNQ
jgi:hypothetical protein